jgi:chloramphenicol-sensitive protein RarD
MAYGIAAYVLWGLFPIYWRFLDFADPDELLAHRVVWCLLVVVLLLAVQRQWAWLRVVGNDRAAMARMSLAAALIGVNWYLYIYGVNSDRVVETALGYFINPIVTVLIGVVVLAERLRPVQWAAIGLGTVAVLVLTVDYGRPPWIALGLAFTFAFYGLLKKQVGASVGAVQSLTIETAVLFLPALGWLLWLGSQEQLSFGHVGYADSFWLATTGIATAIPLLFFAAAARRIPLSVIGLLQYLAPVLQFLCGVVVFDEPMPTSRWIGFTLVWAALVVLTVDSLHHRQRTRRRDREAEIVPIEV